MGSAPQLPKSSGMPTGQFCEGCGAQLPPQNGSGRRKKWCSDRCRKQTLYSTPCIDCGAPVNGSDGRGAHARCQRCDGRRAGARVREQFNVEKAEQRERLVALVAAGLTNQQIADEMGTTPGTVGCWVYRLRRYGYDIPQRPRGRRKATAHV